ncbi:MAG: hypothetical protein ACO1PB_17860 [Ramlibacter sp.]
MRAPRLGDQLLCLVVPLAPGRTPLQVAGELRARGPDLDLLFRTHGGIHFATFSVLPSSPEQTPEPSDPALSLTLGVDPGAKPEETLERLATLAPLALQGIYGVGSAEELKRLMLDPAHLQKLAGGFVGARDRSVAQVVAEAGLARDLRARAQAKPAATREDARQLATELAAETLADPRFAWARQPAQQGNWRAQVAPGWLRLAATARWLVGIGFILLALSTLEMIGFAVKLSVAALNVDWIGIHDPRRELTVANVYHHGGLFAIVMRGLAFVLLAIIATAAILVRRRRLPAGALESVLVAAALIALVVVPCLAGLALWDLSREVPTELHVARSNLIYGLWVLTGLVAFVAMLAACALFALVSVPPHLSGKWLVAAALAAFGVGLVAIHYVLAALVMLANRYQFLGKQWYQPLHPWSWQPVDRIALVVVAIAIAVGALFWLLASLFPHLERALEQLNLPSDKDRKLHRRLHQTAPSISFGEADWMGRPGVVVSLTEIRRPYVLHRLATRFFLWVISSLGWHYYSEGKLGNVDSIHYAHWHVVDKGRRLLFCSNFDGDFGGYLDQFILGRVPLMNLIWRWTRLGNRPGLVLGGVEADAAPTGEMRFPPTRLLLFAGCRREQQFKAYARESMVPFQYHFTAYDHPVSEVLRSTQLRDALTAQRTPAGDAWLMRSLES